MFCKLSARCHVKRILLISLSNIGDVVMTFPVFDALHETFPEAEMMVMVGPKAKGFFVGNPWVKKTIVYDKHLSWVGKLRWFWELRRERFDLVVDLRNSLLPFLLNTRYLTRPVFLSARGHMKEKHVRRLHLVVKDPVIPRDRYALYLSTQEMASVSAMIPDTDRYILIAPGAAHRLKRWTGDGFWAAIRHIVDRYGRKVVLVGDQSDRAISERLAFDRPEQVIDLCGFTTLLGLAGVVKGAELAITNDSGIMHLASYFDIPTIALFGPTDPALYGPWSSRSRVLRQGTAMQDITSADVLNAIDQELRI